MHREIMATTACSSLQYSSLHGVSLTKSVGSGAFRQRTRLSSCHASTQTIAWPKLLAPSKCRRHLLPARGMRADRNDTSSSSRSYSSTGSSAASNCPVCGGTGQKPCGQCDGTGVNLDDVFGGRYKKGDSCWLCDGKAMTMCGNCMDLTDAF